MKNLTSVLRAMFTAVLLTLVIASCGGGEGLPGDPSVPTDPTIDNTGNGPDEEGLCEDPTLSSPEPTPSAP